MDRDLPIRVEDHALCRRGPRSLLDAHDLEVVGEASNGEAGARLAAELHPDVIVMDLHMPIMGGVEATRRISERGDRSRILALTVSIADADVLDAVHAGVAGYCSRTPSPTRSSPAVARAPVPHRPGARGPAVARERLRERRDRKPLLVSRARPSTTCRRSPGNSASRAVSRPRYMRFYAGLV